MQVLPPPVLTVLQRTSHIDPCRCLASLAADPRGRQAINALPDAIPAVFAVLDSDDLEARVIPLDYLGGNASLVARYKR